MSDDKVKKTRRNWLINESDLITKETSFDMTLVTEVGNEFLKMYGAKQYLVDKIANKGGIEFSDQERSDAMQERFDNLCNDKFKLVHTEAGFYFKDPDAVPVSRGGGIGRSKVVQGLMDKHNWTEDKAIIFWNEISAK